MVSSNPATLTDKLVTTALLLIVILAHYGLPGTTDFSPAAAFNAREHRMNPPVQLASLLFDAP